MVFDAVQREFQFLSTPSARRATVQADSFRHPGAISIHALREEGDVEQASLQQNHSISIHALREEGDTFLPQKTHRLPISIHALREEGDGDTFLAFSPEYHFYPRPPRGGRRRLGPDV